MMDGSKGNGSAPSSYLQYLPAPYHGDAFMGRFLHIFEDVLAPIERIIDTLASYFDPVLTPSELLPWLASWVDVELDQNWPESRRRALVQTTASLYRWQGTRRGLREHVRLYTGHAPLIVENCDGLRLGQDAALGLNTRLAVARPHHVSVTVVKHPADAIDEQVVRNVIEVEKPAHVRYALEIVEVTA